MATGASILGNTQLDLLSINEKEVATFGNLGCNVIVNVYNQNAPFQNQVSFGISNAAFAMVSRNADTRIGIGTDITSAGVLLQVAGATTVQSNVMVGTTTIRSQRLFINSGGILQTGAEGTSNVVAMDQKLGVGKVPQTTLDVVGNSLITGTITANQVSIVDKFRKTGTATYGLYQTTGDTKTIITNDNVATKRVLYSFNVKQGWYTITGNISFMNMSSMVVLDTVNWATIGLYKTTPAGYNNSLTPVYQCPLTSIGGGLTPYESVPFSTFIQMEDVSGADFVIAVQGAGHELQFKGYVSVIPMRGLGVNENSNLRSSFQPTLIRRTFVATSGQQDFSITETGVFVAASSNIDVFLNGIKNSNITLTQSTSATTSTFTVRTNTAQTAGTNVDVSVWAKPVDANYYSATYLQQYGTTFAYPCLNVVGGGIMVPGGRMVVDGDVFLSGTSNSQQSISSYTPVVSASSIRSSITCNIIDAYHLSNNIVTASKIQPLAVTQSKIAPLAIVNSKIGISSLSNASFGEKTIDTQKLLLAVGNVGVGTQPPRASWHVNGTVMTNTSFVLTNNNNSTSYDFEQSGSSYIVKNKTLNLTGGALLQLDYPQVNTTLGSAVTSWGPLTPTGAGTCIYNSGYRFVQCSGRYLSTSAAPFSTSMNLTVSTYALFGTGSGTGDVLFLVANSGFTTYVRVMRNSLVSTSLDVNVCVNGTIYTLTLSGAIVNNEFALYTLVIGENTFVSVYRNGTLIGTSMQLGAPFSGVYSLNVSLCYNHLTGVSGAIAYESFYMYNRILNADDLAIVTAHLLQNTMQHTLPIFEFQHAQSIAADSVLGSVPDMIVPANVRVHALPIDPLWVTDTPAVLSSPLYLHAKSRGFTFVTRMQFTSIPSSTETVCMIGKNFVQITRATGMLNITVSIKSIQQFVTSASLALNIVHTVAFTIDSFNRVSIWINGVLDTSASFTGTLEDTLCEFIRLGDVGTTCIYDRALTSTEIGTCHVVLTYDTTRSFNTGTRTGRSAFSVTKDGVVPAIAVGSVDVVPGLVAHLSFDYHLFDTTGKTTLSPPTSRGMIGFARGRLGQSLSLVGGSSITYSFLKTVLMKPLSIAFWIEPYNLSANSFVLSLTNDTVTLVSISILSATMTVEVQVRSNSGDTVIITTPQIKSQEWNHIALVIADYQLTLYLNGLNVATNLNTIFPFLEMKSLNIGNATSYCEIDDLRIWNLVIRQNVPQQLTSMTYMDNLVVEPEGALVANSDTVKLGAPLQLSDSTVVATNPRTNGMIITSSQYDIRDFTNTHLNITPGGGASVSTASPFGDIADEGSISFPGYVELPSVSGAIGAVSMECWVNYQSYSNASFTLGALEIPCLINRYDRALNIASWNFGMTRNGNLALAWSNTNGVWQSAQGTTNMQLNTWYHIAFSALNNNVRTFLNGMLESSSSAFTNVATNTNIITLGNFSNTSPLANVSGVRYTSNNLYTANFRVPQTPLVTTSNTFLMLRAVKSPSTAMSISATEFVAPSVPSEVYRNRIINGHMYITQRGVPFTFTNPGTTETTTLDRWNMHFLNVTSGTLGVTQIGLGSTSEAPYTFGFTRSMRITASTAFSSYAAFSPLQRIEGQMVRDFAWTGNGNGSFVTVSFWFRATQVGTYQICIDSASPASPQSFVQGFSNTASGVWQFVSITVPPPPGANNFMQNSNAEAFSLRIGNTTRMWSDIGTTYGWTLPGTRITNVLGFTDWVATANNYIEFTGVQLEDGQISTPFEMRPYAIELGMCQTYYETSGGTISLYPGCDSYPGDFTNINVGVIVPMNTSKRSTAYQVTTLDSTSATSRISAKFAGYAASNGITPVLSNLNTNSFYVAFSGGSNGFQGVTNTTYGNFIRGNMNFRWNVNNEMADSALGNITFLDNNLIRRKFFNATNDYFGTSFPGMNFAFSNTSNNELTFSGAFMPVPSDTFHSLEYTGWMVLPTTGDYTFGLRSDDASDFCIYINGKWDCVTTAYWYKGAETTPPNPGTRTLIASVYYPVRLRYCNGPQSGSLYMDWQTPTNSTYTSVPFTIFKCNGFIPISSASIRQYFPEPIQTTNSADITPYLLAYLIRRRFPFGSIPDSVTAMDSAYNNMTYTELTYTRSFIPPANEDYYALEYTGWMVLPVNGTYTFGVRSDDGSDFAIYLDGAWDVITTAYGAKGAEATPPNPGTRSLLSSVRYPIRVRYYERTGGEQLYVQWKTPLNPSANFSDIPFSVFSCYGIAPLTLQSLRTNFPDPRV